MFITTQQFVQYANLISVSIKLARQVIAILKAVSNVNTQQMKSNEELSAASILVQVSTYQGFF